METENFISLKTLVPDENQHARGTDASMPSTASTNDIRGSSGSSFVGTSRPDSIVELDSENKAMPSDLLHELYPVSSLELPDHHIDDVRSLRVTVIGAGISGIISGVLLPAKVPKIQLTILEKNDDVVRSRWMSVLMHEAGADDLNKGWGMAGKHISRGEM